MKKAVIVGSLLVVALAIAVTGCGSKKASNPKPVTPSNTSPLSTSPTESQDSSLAGNYTSDKSASDKMELRANHTFDITRNGRFTSGQWTVQDDKVLFSAGSFNDSFTVEDNILVEQDGTRWTKRQ